MTVAAVACGVSFYQTLHFVTPGPAACSVGPSERGARTRSLPPNPDAWVAVAAEAHLAHPVLRLKDRNTSAPNAPERRRAQPWPAQGCLPCPNPGLPELPRARGARYIIISISSGTDPTNRLWYMPLAALPVNASTGALDLSRYDMRLPAAQRAALPLTKLVDDFRAVFGVVASQGPLWTIQTTLHAPRSRRARRPRLPAPAPFPWRLLQGYALSSAQTVHGGGGAGGTDGAACDAAGRVVRVNISDPGPADSWQEVLAQHPRDQLTAATAVKARGPRMRPARVEPRRHGACCASRRAHMLPGTNRHAP